MVRERERGGGYLRHSKFAEKAPMERKMPGKVILRLMAESKG